MAITSLILGIAGFLIIPVLASIAALIIGIIALKKVKETGEAGKGMAITGIVLGSVGIVLIPLFILMFVGMFAYFGVLSPDRMISDRCYIGGGFNCVSHDRTATGFEITLQNGLGTDADNVMINIISPDCIGQKIVGSLSNGDNTVIEASCSGTGRISADVQVAYTTGGSALPKQTLGSVVLS